MLSRAKAENVGAIDIPCIGTDYGGLSWKKLRPLIEHIFEGWEGMLYVYEDYITSNKENHSQDDDSKQ